MVETDTNKMDKQPASLYTAHRRYPEKNRNILIYCWIIHLTPCRILKKKSLQGLFIKYQHSSLNEGQNIKLRTKQTKINPINPSPRKDISYRCPYESFP
ncbi:hypothetical protein KTH_28980 [Thermosporothrix hazakensis]|nr:hypothetical protein KTH_28980 [Thermosporothrix hazakensis]